MLDRRRLILALLACGGLTLAAPAVFAESGSGNSGSGSGGGGNHDDDDGDEHDGDDQKRVRDAVHSGKAVKLKDLLRSVKDRYPGDIVSVSATGSDRELSYAIKLIDANNRLVSLRVNARTGAISPF